MTKGILITPISGLPYILLHSCKPKSTFGNWAYNFILQQRNRFFHFIFGFNEISCLLSTWYSFCKLPCSQTLGFTCWRTCTSKASGKEQRIYVLLRKEGQLELKVCINTLWSLLSFLAELRDLAFKISHLYLLSTHRASKCSVHHCHLRVQNFIQYLKIDEDILQLL